MIHYAADDYSLRYNVVKNDGRLKFSNVLCHVTSIAVLSTSPCKILMKSANRLPSYCQKMIFNMAGVRHLEFYYFHFMVT